MQENTTPEVCLREARAIEGLRLAKEEVRRACALGLVPESIDQSDLESVADEAITEAINRNQKAMRLTIRHRLHDYLTHEIYTENRASFLMPEPDENMSADPPHFDIDPKWVAGLLAQLTARQLKVIRLIYYDGHSTHSAATVLGIAHVVVLEHERAALSRLRKQIAKKT